MTSFWHSLHADENLSLRLQRHISFATVSDVSWVVPKKHLVCNFFKMNDKKFKFI